MSTLQTNVPPVTITETGISVPQTQDILSGTLQDINAAFGGNLNVTSVSTPQYVLSAERAQAIALAYASLAFTLSQFDPDTAIGRFQDALARIYFITRKSGTPTIVSATCTGIPGNTLPVGSLARDTSGNVYESWSAVSFGSNGQATVQFANQVSGAIPCAAGSLVYIQVAVPGWDAITNESPGVTGTDVEGRDAFELRRQESVALNATGTAPAIRAAVSEIDEVTDCFVCDNPSDETIQYGATNYELAPHSVYVGVVGGDDDTVAQTIWTKKDIGCGMNGNTTVTVYDDSAYVTPYPEYQITFNRPTPTEILFAVTIQQNTQLPSDVIAQIQSAIIAAFNGQVDGFARPRIGGAIYASSYYRIVSAVSSQINIISIQIGTSEANQNAVTMGIDQVPVIQQSGIQVTIS